MDRWNFWHRRSPLLGAPSQSPGQGQIVDELVVEKRWLTNTLL